MVSVNNKLFSVGMIRNHTMDVSKKMQMEVILGEDENFHYKFTKGKDKLNCIFGTYKTIQFSSIKDLGQTIENGCTAKDVFVSGLAPYDEVEVLTPTQIQKREISGTLPRDYIQRTANNFNWSNTAGLLTIDIDGYKDKYFTKEEALDLLYKAVPEFKDAPILIKPSTSSCVYYEGKYKVEDENCDLLRLEGEEGRTDLTKKSGLRFYIVISSLNWLHRAKQFLETRFWNIGFGYLDFNRNGVENFRCVIDPAMYSSTDRADFIKASLEEDVPGLIQDFGEFEYINENNSPLDIRTIPDLTQEEIGLFESLKKKARQDPNNVERQKKIKETYLEDRIVEAEQFMKGSVANLTEKDRVSIRKNITKSVKRLYESKVIDRLHPLYIFNKETGNVQLITTDDIFKDEISARKYHGMYCASVVDPYYTPGKRYDGENQPPITIMGLSKFGDSIDFLKAKILSLNEPPSILDQSHGGTRFFFDTEFFDIAKLEKKRKDTRAIKLPLYNLTDIANAFINQYNKENTDDVENFGNILKNLEHELGDIAFKVFDTVLDSGKVISKNVWDNLTGYGPSIYDFTHKNPDEWDAVDLSESEILTKVNKLDVKHRMNLMRKTYTKVMLPGGDFQFLTKKWDNKFGWTYDMHPKTGVMGYYHDDEYYKLTSSNNKTIKEEVSKLWFKREHNKFPNLEFHPVPGIVATNDNYVDGTSPDAFNLYTGLNLVPKPKIYEEVIDNELKTRKGWHLLDKHIYEILCDKDKTKYEYMMNWIANMFQYPHRMGETILAFQGEEGTGKNTVWDAIITAFGSFGKNIVDGDLVLGNFNEVISKKILIVLNEAVWEGDVKGHGKLKSITTEPFLEISEKYKNSITVKNTLHIVIMTNHEAVAPMGPGDRRIVTFDVNNKHSCNRAYFGKLRKEINSGGIESFVYDMINRDITDFNISKLPNDTHSEAAINSIMNSAAPWLKWWYECLQDDMLYGYNIGNAPALLKSSSADPSEREETDCLSELLKLWSGRVPIKILFDSYNEWKEESRYTRDRMTSNAFTRHIKKILIKQAKKDTPYLEGEDLVSAVHKKCKVQVGTVKKSRNCLIMDDLEKQRESMEGYLKHKITWFDIQEEDEKLFELIGDDVTEEEEKGQ